MAKFKKRSRPRLPHESSPARKVLLVCLVVFLAAFFMGGAWFLTKLGPRNVDYREVSIDFEVSEETAELKSKSIELEAQFEEVMVLREPLEKDIQLILQARDLQKQYMDALTKVYPEAERRYRYLDQRYQNLAAASLRDQSLELEAEGESLAGNKDYEAAGIKFGEAYALQDRINQRFPLSSAYNVGRATRLQRKARYQTAEPLLQRSVAFEAEASEWIEKQEWEKAEKSLREAIALQDQLNRDYRGSNQANVARLGHLRIQLVGVLSGQSYLEIEELLAIADAHRMEGENLQAARIYQEAARLQLKLNETYRDSPYASAERVSEFLRKAETAESFELGLRIERDHDALKQLLANRRTQESAEVIVSLSRDMKQMKEAYPRSSLNDDELQLKIRYLNHVQSDIGFIQDRVYDALLPIPENEEWKILRTEVPQALYAVIMGNNPSRNRGDVNPVDSVSWIDAKNFCERLSWIMGKPVRLPTENEFRASLGRLRYVVLEDHVWSVSDTQGVSQPIGRKKPFEGGYYDLLGNVSEWLESIDRFETEDARHIGGHAQDRLEAIFTVPVREAPRGERNRMTGFRIVMQTQ